MTRETLNCDRLDSCDRRVTDETVVTCENETAEKSETVVTCETLIIMTGT